MILKREKEKEDEEEEQEEKEDEEDEDEGEEEESFIFREAATQWLMSETCKTAGHQLTYRCGLPNSEAGLQNPSAVVHVTWCVIDKGYPNEVWAKAQHAFLLPYDGSRVSLQLQEGVVRLALGMFGLCGEAGFGNPQALPCQGVVLSKVASSGPEATYGVPALQYLS
ncbi:hypothetical protein AAES_167601 [Amazona aestiva]|uniref:Uncharacterized protein n=1 Tax=Amazona aestiva TaxID=12930 RepID=A0A0Q3PBF3_AMAAE|nr:hypothetical protein AAES_167601 [Amazona aestiva]